MSKTVTNNRWAIISLMFILLQNKKGKFFIYQYLSESKIGRSEVMWPLWQTVGLINTHKGYRGQRGPIVQQRHPTPCHRFRGHQQEVNFALFDILEHTFPLSRGHVGMKACSLYTRWQASHLCRENKKQNAAWNILYMHIPGISIHKHTSDFRFRL